MNLEWKKLPRASWANERTLWAGKIRIAELFKNIGSKGSKDTYRLVFLLPQIKVDNTLSVLPEESLSEAKAHAETVVTKWFEATKEPT